MTALVVFVLIIFEIFAFLVLYSIIQFLSNLPCYGVLFVLMMFYFDKKTSIWAMYDYDGDQVGSVGGSGKTHKNTTLVSSHGRGCLFLMSNELICFSLLISTGLRDHAVTSCLAYKSQCSSFSS